MHFEWDPNKNQANIAKHGVDFSEALTIFSDPLELTVADPDHSMDEYRYLSIGLSASYRLLVVSYSERNGDIRLISARPATKVESTQYESGS